MVTLRCLSKTGKKPLRFNLDVESLSQTVSELRKCVSGHVKMSPFEIELIYAGRSLKDDVKMEQYGLKPGCTVHVLVKKYRDTAMVTEPLHSEGISQVNTILKLAEISSKHRQTIEKVLTNSEVIDNIIEATPGLAADHLAIALLRDHILLQQAAREEEVIKKILHEHPSLGVAVQHLVSVINEEIGKSKKDSSNASSAEAGAGSSQLVSSYSIDSLSEEEDDNQLGGPSWGTVHQNRPITADQLAMALAMATGAMGGQPPRLPPPSSTSAGLASSSSPFAGLSSSPAAGGASSSHAPPATAASSSTASSSALAGRQPPSSLFSPQPPVMPTPTPPGSGGQSRLISPTFFQQAMQAALVASDSSESNSSSNAAAIANDFAENLFDEDDTIFGALLGAAAAAAGANSGAASSASVSDAAVEQLRQMGITDEEVARRALEATGGDIRAALDLIFGDGLMF